ncbi:MAG: hypothetical protein ABWZ80_04575 [Beijerinckiaceae bacterium]
MLGRATKSLICIGAITLMAAERPANEWRATASDAARTIAAHASAACLADLRQCAAVARTVGRTEHATTGLSRDTLTDADRKAAPPRRG